MRRNDLLEGLAATWREVLRAMVVGLTVLGIAVAAILVLFASYLVYHVYYLR